MENLYTIKVGGEALMNVRGADAQLALARYLDNVYHDTAWEISAEPKLFADGIFIVRFGNRTRIEYGVTLIMAGDPKNDPKPSPSMAQLRVRLERATQKLEYIKARPQGSPWDSTGYQQALETYMDAYSAVVEREERDARIVADTARMANALERIAATLEVKP